VAELRVFDQSSLKPRLEQAFDFVARQVRLTVERTPDYFPIHTVGGRWLHRGELWTDWCGGFHAGMMWLIACRTGDSWWRRTSEHYSGLLEHRQHDRNVHELKHRGKSEFSFARSVSTAGVLPLAASSRDRVPRWSSPLATESGRSYFTSAPDRPPIERPGQAGICSSDR